MDSHSRVYETLLISTSTNYATIFGIKKRSMSLKGCLGGSLTSSLHGGESVRDSNVVWPVVRVGAFEACAATCFTNVNSNAFRKPRETKMTV